MTSIIDFERKPRRHFKNYGSRYRTVLYTFVSSLLVLLIVVYSLNRNYEKEDVLKLRTIEHIVQEPKPPKPKPEVERKNFQETNSVASLLAEPSKVPVDFSLTQLSTKLSHGQTARGIAGRGLESSLDAYLEHIDSIDSFPSMEFDEVPRALYKPSYRLPKEVLAQGITAVDAVVAVYISETGEATFLGFESISTEALKPFVARLVEQIKFTPPRIEGKAYGGKFSMPLALR